MKNKLCILFVQTILLSSCGSTPITFDEYKEKVLNVRQYFNYDYFALSSYEYKLNGSSKNQDITFSYLCSYDKDSLKIDYTITEKSVKKSSLTTFEFLDTSVRHTVDGVTNIYSQESNYNEWEYFSKIWIDYFTYNSFTDLLLSPGYMLLHGSYNLIDDFESFEGYKIGNNYITSFALSATKEQLDMSKIIRKYIERRYEAIKRSNDIPRRFVFKNLDAERYPFITKWYGDYNDDAIADNIEDVTQPQQNNGNQNSNNGNRPNNRNNNNNRR